MVAAVWGTEFIQLLAALAILHQDDLKTWIDSSYSSYHSGPIHPMFHIILVQFVLYFISFWCKIGKELSHFYSPNNSDDLCLLFCFYPSSMVTWSTTPIFSSKQTNGTPREQAKVVCESFHFRKHIVLESLKFDLSALSTTTRGVLSLDAPLYRCYNYGYWGL